MVPSMKKGNHVMSLYMKLSSFSNSLTGDKDLSSGIKENVLEKLRRRVEMGGEVLGEVESGEAGESGDELWRGLQFELPLDLRFGKSVLERISRVKLSVAQAGIVIVLVEKCRSQTITGSTPMLSGRPRNANYLHVVVAAVYVPSGDTIKTRVL